MFNHLKFFNPSWTHFFNILIQTSLPQSQIHTKNKETPFKETKETSPSPKKKNPKKNKQKSLSLFLSPSIFLSKKKYLGQEYIAG